MCFNIYTNEVVTIAEAAETVEMTETTADEAQHEWISSRRKGRFESGFFNYQAWQIWETMPANIFGDQGNSVKVFWIKVIKGTIDFINGEQEIKGSWENVPPPPP